MPKNKVSDPITDQEIAFARLVCFQSFPDAALPDELKSTNPLGIMRMVDGERTRTPSSPVKPK